MLRCSEKSVDLGKGPDKIMRNMTKMEELEKEIYATLHEAEKARATLLTGIMDSHGIVPSISEYTVEQIRKGYLNVAKICRKKIKLSHENKNLALECARNLNRERVEDNTLEVDNNGINTAIIYSPLQLEESMEKKGGIKRVISTEYHNRTDEVLDNKKELIVESVQQHKIPLKKKRRCSTKSSYVVPTLNTPTIMTSQSTFQQFEVTNNQPALKAQFVHKKKVSFKKNQKKRRYPSKTHSVVYQQIEAISELIHEQRKLEYRSVQKDMSPEKKQQEECIGALQSYEVYPISPILILDSQESVSDDVQETINSTYTQPELIVQSVQHHITNKQKEQQQVSPSKKHLLVSLEEKAPLLKISKSADQQVEEIVNKLSQLSLQFDQSSTKKQHIDCTHHSETLEKSSKNKYKKPVNPSKRLGAVATLETPVPEISHPTVEMITKVIEDHVAFSFESNQQYQTLAKTKQNKCLHPPESIGASKDATFLASFSDSPNIYNPKVTIHSNIMPETLQSLPLAKDNKVHIESGFQSVQNNHFSQEPMVNVHVPRHTSGLFENAQPEQTISNKIQEELVQLSISLEASTISETCRIKTPVSSIFSLSPMNIRTPELLDKYYVNSIPDTVQCFTPNPDDAIMLLENSTNVLNIIEHNSPFDPNRKECSICRYPSFGDIITCSNEKCPIVWFHYPCVGVTISPKGKWFCLQCSPLVKHTSDGKK